MKTALITLIEKQGAIRGKISIYNVANGKLENEEIISEEDGVKQVVIRDNTRITVGVIEKKTTLVLENFQLLEKRGSILIIK